MKQLLFLTLILLPSLGLTQKTFAPLGKVWNYELPSEYDPSIDNCRPAHYQLVVEEELMIDGKDCSLIRAHNLGGAVTGPNDSLIVWEQQDKVYFLEDTTFLLYLDFGAMLGDTIVTYDPYDRGLFTGSYYDGTSTFPAKITMEVIEVRNLIVNGVETKVMTLYDNDPLTRYAPHEVLAGIGSLSTTLGGQYLSTVANGCDGGFICYSDGNLGYQYDANSVEHPGCSIVDRVDEKSAVDFSVSPNPFSEKLRLTIEESRFQVQLYDAAGQLLLSTKDARVMDTASLLPGIYTLHLRTNEGIGVKRLVKI